MSNECATTLDTLLSCQYFYFFFDEQYYPCSQKKQKSCLETCIKTQNQKALCNCWKGKVTFCIRNSSYDCQKQLHQKEALIGRMLFLDYLVLTKAQTGKSPSEASYGYLIKLFNVTLLYIEISKLSKAGVVLMMNTVLKQLFILYVDCIGFYYKLKLAEFVYTDLC